MSADLVTGAAFAIGTALFVSYFFLIDKFQKFLVVGLWSIFWICIVFAFMDIIFADCRSYGPINLGMYLMLFIGMGLLGAGWFLYKRPVGHILAIVGWQLFGLFWLFNIPTHFHNGDYINLMFLGGGFALFTVLGYHEQLSIRFDEEHRGLKFMAGATFITGFIYFYLASDWVIIKYFTNDMAAVRGYSLGYMLVEAVAQQSSDVANLLFGYNTFITEGHILPPEGIGIPIENTEGRDIGGISLILACTGIEAIALFFGAIMTVEYEKDPWKDFRKIRPRMEWYRKRGKRMRIFLSLMATLPTIYFLNLFRNAFIIHFIKQETFYDIAGDLGMDEFTLLHGVIAKIFAFVVLIILALIIFEIIPELHITIMSLFDLNKRDAPKEVMEARRKKAMRKRELERKRKEAKEGDGSGEEE